MKATNQIKKLAEKVANSDSYTSTDFIIEELNNLKSALLNGRYYTGVNSVSSSGMSRKITIGYIKNNQFRRIHHPGILKLAGCDKNGRIGGCGMDMLFAAQYNLFRELCPKHRYQSAMKRYNTL